ncbi:MAG: FAD-dependent oxidoreductase [Snowella sp.]|nr:FAD-dependent oxidoreductase [Snowella sp.]
MNTYHLYDVIIVGAGPVGLATAIALYQRGITNILVIDQTQEFRPVGQGLDLLPNGLKALRYIDEQYEQIRRPFMVKMQDATLHSYHLSQSQWENYNDWVYGRDIAQICQGL